MNNNNEAVGAVEQPTADGKSTTSIVAQTMEIVIAGKTFELREEGVYIVEPDDEKGRWICGPLEIVADTADHQGKNCGRLLRITGLHGHIHSWAMPMSMLAGDGGELRAHLLDLGLTIAPGRRERQELMVYLSYSPGNQMTAVDRVGWFGSAYVLPDETIGENAQNIVFQPSAVGHNLSRVSGTLGDWRGEIGCLCSGNSVLILSVSAAFAGPLLEPLNCGGGGFHFRGTSSIGKSTTLTVAGSVCGGGGERGFLRTWRATSNAIESIAASHNHGLLLLDEIAECDPRSLSEVAYMLGNGAGRLRLTRNISLRSPMEWRLLFLSSGEITLSDHLATEGRRTRAGQEVRIVNLEADVGAGFGIFETLHGFAGGDALADHLTKASRHIYGSPIREFLKQVVNDLQDIRRTWRAFEADFISNMVPAGASGEVKRVANRFALVAYAGELATRRGITGWAEGEALMAATIHFGGWLVGRGTSGAVDEKRAIDQVRLFIEKHGAQRFQRLGDEREANPVSNRAGFIRPKPDGTIECYNFLPSVFKDEVCAGFDLTTVLQTLRDQKYLETDNEGIGIKGGLEGLGANSFASIASGQRLSNSCRIQREQREHMGTDTFYKG